MHQHNVIRRATTNDEAPVTELAVINNMFAVDELDDFVGMFRGAATGALDGHQWFVAVTPDERVPAAAYLAPEPFADRVWNLYFIAVHPADHGQGAGSPLTGISRAFFEMPVRAWRGY